MIEDRIENIEARLKESAQIPEAKRAELLQLLAALKRILSSASSLLFWVTLKHPEQN